MSDTEPSSLVTGEELAKLGDIGPRDLVEGRIVHMHPTGPDHGCYEEDFALELRKLVDEHLSLIHI